jgi:hypothetical protein
MDDDGSGDLTTAAPNQDSFSICDRPRIGIGHQQPYQTAGKIDELYRNNKTPVGKPRHLLPLRSLNKQGFNLKRKGHPSTDDPSALFQFLYIYHFFLMAGRFDFKALRRIVIQIADDEDQLAKAFRISQLEILLEIFLRVNVADTAGRRLHPARPVKNGCRLHCCT